MIASHAPNCPPNRLQPRTRRASGFGFRFRTMILPRWAAVSLFAATIAGATPAIDVVPADSPDAFPLVDPHGAATIVVDAQDYPVVTLAAGLFADDIGRVTGHRPTVAPASAGGMAVIVGTLGHSVIVDRLAAAGKLRDSENLKGRWETTLWQIVDRPMPGMTVRSSSSAAIDAVLPSDSPIFRRRSECLRGCGGPTCQCVMRRSSR